jgi:glycosyltransferase involved in cell wall biosynthesis
MLTLTIVVPTLWKPSDFPDYIKSVADLSIVKEIIIIDNNHKDSHSIDHPKVRIIEQARNIYVNPAWNLGTRLASGDILCLLNDDLIAKHEVYSYVIQLFEEDKLCEIGLVGLDWIHPIGDLECREIFERNSGYFGCLMFMRTCDYYPIPEILKIWWGDDFLMQRCFLKSKKILAVSGYALTKQEGSKSINDERKSFTPLLAKDSFLWSKVIRPLLFFRYRPALGIKMYLKKIFRLN